MAELVSSIELGMSSFGNWEVILVNDCSPDNGETWLAICDASNTNSNIIGIDLQKNAGQFHATICGLERSTGDIIVLMDDDLQHGPEHIRTLVDALEEQDADCVMGRYEIKHHSIIRNLGSWLIRKTFSMLHGLPKGVRMSSFRAIRRSAVDMMIQHQTANPVMGALVLGSCRKIINVSVPHNARPYGNSGYRFKRLVKPTLDNIFLASTFPLRIFSYLGFVTFTASLVMAGYFAYHYFSFGSEVAGFTTIVL
ncbi:MAG: glycosyltransferase, partial [Candidatus Poseidoniaceae archaeon]|nr:glycosyltransferase [Candidatus Poseidoniaceae archaeon]